MITAKKMINLHLSEDGGEGVQPENPCTVAIIRIGDLAGASAQDLKFDHRVRAIPLPDLYDLEPFSGPEEPIRLEIELYQMEPPIENQ
ncbi:MAG: hypothetical protein QW638_03730 [Candidatus Bathyarchaeia archaeon]